MVESDKATVEVPSTTAGVIKAIHAALGQNVSEGVVLVTIEAEVSSPAPSGGSRLSDTSKTYSSSAATVQWWHLLYRLLSAAQGADKLTKTKMQPMRKFAGSCST